MCSLLEIANGHVFFTIFLFQLQQKGFRTGTTCGLLTDTIRTPYDGYMPEKITHKPSLCWGNHHLFGLAMNGQCVR